MSPVTLATVLARQERSRRKLREAAARYTNLRAATGTHTDTIRTSLRDGTPVAVLITLELVPDPAATEEP